MKVPTDADFSFDAGNSTIPPHWYARISGLQEAHVMPEFDEKPHDWRFCACIPRIQPVMRYKPGLGYDEYIGTIYIHSPFKQISVQKVAASSTARTRARGKRSPRSAVGIEINRLAKLKKI
jgi:hypothetical protein